MDITMPKLDGIEATRLIKRKYPAMVVIGLSDHTAGQVEVAMREAWAAASLNKEVAVDQLLSGNPSGPGGLVISISQSDRGVQSAVDSLP